VTALLDAQAASVQEKTGGLEEKLATLALTSAELERGLADCAPKESVDQLEARVDGGFDAMLVRLETQRWVSENVDKVADSVSQQFLHLIDDYVQQLRGRMEKCEKALKAAGQG